ncbi:hypothetical protein ACWEPA_25475 [Streptomyces filamentosus]
MACQTHAAGRELVRVGPAALLRLWLRGGQATGEIGGELSGRLAVVVRGKLFQDLEQLDHLASLCVGEQSKTGFVGAGAGYKVEVVVHAVFNGSRPGEGTGGGRPLPAVGWPAETY